jgi:tetratricopeptide (TPR) repeat protein
MKTRHAIIGGAVLLALVATAGLTWFEFGMPSQDDDETMTDDAPLPLPPVPPRIAEGHDYEQCLSMLTTDPSGASSFAEAWEATGGGDGATHCLGLATIATGDPEKGAEMLEKLAASSKGTAVARATIYGQANQAWIFANRPDHAYEAASKALTLSPDDPDLLIDRAVAGDLLERYQDVIDDLTAALDLDPHRTDAYVYRGTAWRHLGHPELARDDIDRALTLDPDQPEALLERGILRQMRQDWRGARNDWERAAALAPDSPTADLAQQNLALLEAGPAR